MVLRGFLLLGHDTLLYLYLTGGDRWFILMVFVPGLDEFIPAVFKFVAYRKLRFFVERKGIRKSDGNYSWELPKPHFFNKPA